MSSITEPSICIPRVSINITKQYIKKIFEEIFGINSIERIDLVKKTYSNNNIYYTTFIHFNYWNDSNNVQAIRNRIINNQTFKIVYHEPWFWKCSISKAIKPVIYTSHDEKSIVKRYDNTIANEPYNEVLHEINHILNNKRSMSPIPIRRSYTFNQDAPSIVRQSGYHYHNDPPYLTRQNAFNSAN